MLEIIIMIIVIGWFARTAKAKGKSKVLWGFIGGISYYGPVFLFSIVIYPELIRGKVTYSNQFSYVAVGILLSILLGIGSCLIARKILISYIKPEVTDQ